MPVNTEQEGAVADKFEGWEKGADGNIVINPLAGYDGFVPFGMMCGLRLHYVRSEQEMRTGVHRYLPLVMTPAQARELAAVLLRNAEAAERTPQTPGS